MAAKLTVEVGSAQGETQRARMAVAKLTEEVSAAQRDVQTPPDGYGDLAAAHPQDPDYWAWMCAAA